MSSNPDALLRGASEQQLKDLWNRDDLSDEKRNSLRTEIARRGLAGGGGTQEAAPDEAEGFLEGFGESVEANVKAPFQLAEAGIKNIAGNIRDEGVVGGLAESGMDLLSTGGSMVGGLAELAGESVQAIARTGLAGMPGEFDAGPLEGAMGAIGLGDIGSFAEESEELPFVGRVIGAEPGERLTEAGKVAGDLAFDVGGGLLARGMRGAGVARRASRAAQGRPSSVPGVPLLPSQTDSGIDILTRRRKAIAARGEGKPFDKSDLKIRDRALRAEMRASPEARAMQDYKVAQAEGLIDAQVDLVKEVRRGARPEAIADAMGTVVRKLDNSLDELDARAKTQYTRLDNETRRAVKDKGANVPRTDTGEVRMVTNGKVREVAADAAKALAASDTLIGSRTAIRVQRQIERVLKQTEQSGTFKSAQNARTRLRKQAANEIDPQAAQILRDLERAVDAEMDAGLARFGELIGDDTMVREWRKANRNYRNLQNVRRDPALRRMLEVDPESALATFRNLKPATQKTLVRRLRTTDGGAEALQGLKSAMLDEDVFGASSKLAPRKLDKMRRRGLLSDDEFERAQDMLEVKDRIGTNVPGGPAGPAMRDLLTSTALSGAVGVGLGLPSAGVAAVVSLARAVGGSTIAAAYVTNPQLLRHAIGLAQAGRVAAAASVLAGRGVQFEAKFSAQADEQPNAAAQ